jgi:hypothetical protein
VFETALLERPPLNARVRVLLTIWFLILIPWLPLFTLMGSGMAFDGGPTAGAYEFVVIAWMYPALVAVAFHSRRRRPNLVWLPLIPLSVVFAVFLFAN